MQTFGLDPEDIVAIRSAFAKHPEIESVIIHGSRAVGTCKPYSDIDLTLLGALVTEDTLFELEEELEELYLPQRFDISIYSRIKEAAFKADINTKGVESYRKSIPSV